jgi:hypothetical protein
MGCRIILSGIGLLALADAGNREAREKPSSDYVAEQVRRLIG